MIKLPNRTFEIGLLTAYAVLIAIFSTYHEVWRDEVRAYSIAVTSNGLFDLLIRLKNEGHPLLWYLVLKFFNLFIGDPVALKIASVVVALAATAVFLFSAPFPRWIRSLWPFGYYPLYEYSVSCRNYGLTMLMVFIFCTLYPRRYKRPIVIAGILALLGLTSAYGLILAAALLAALGFELLLLHSEFSRARLPEYLLAAAVAVAGLLWSAVQMAPDRSTTVTSLMKSSAGEFSSALFQAVASHGSISNNGFYLPFPAAIPVLIIGLYFLFIRRPSIPVFLFSTVIGIELMHRLIYSAGALRHQGILFLAVVAALWLDRVTPNQIDFTFPRISPNFRLPDSVRNSVLNGLLTVLLLIQIYMGQKYIRRDLEQPLSSAPQLAELVRSDRRFDNSIIVGEPDYFLETVPYYLDNRIYFPRQGEFNRIIKFTAAAKQKISLDQVLDASLKLNREDPGGVLLLLPTVLEPDGGTITLMYGREFQYTAADLKRLDQLAERIATFDQALTEENFAVYRLQ